ncbi:glutaredoxin [Recurvomyces mirabilis]|uniref:Glutaredoxin n=1 Tax=Recurvomyces mirabilis TaxID=574656 RepID=A0AAE0TMY7_9PEZI|nr:glutaredoxin [Recurvomyces mirabilis]KAK5150017.1 glutaredoxin [Recurvomyces mirabilis]
MNSSAPLSANTPGPAAQSSTPSTSATTCTVQQIASEEEFDQQITALPSSCLSVIYFHAPWAEPCKQMSTILSTLASTYQPGNPQRIAFFGLDAEEVSDISERYDVSQVPLMVLQKDGQVVDSITGTDASKVRNAVEKHAGASKSGDAGKAGLPPAQKVTKPAPSQSLDDGKASMNGNSSLSKYAPNSSDPATAPQFSSGEINGATQEASQEELNARLSELVKAAPVMLFMKGTPSAPQCGFSRQCVSILREKGVRYGFFNILADDEVRQGLKEFSEWPTFPQVYVDGELIGGLDILKEEFENDTEFLKDYSVSAQGKTGGPAAPAKQAVAA